MMEIIVLFIAATAIARRSQARKTPSALAIAALVIGWLILKALAPAIGGFSLVLRWLWIVVVVLFVEHGGAGAGSSDEAWQCPDCRMFNEGDTLVCPCGHDRSASAG